MESVVGIGGNWRHLHLDKSWRLAQGSGAGGRVRRASIVAAMTSAASVSQTFRRRDRRPEAGHGGGRRVARLYKKKVVEDFLLEI